MTFAGVDDRQPGRAPRRHQGRQRLDRPTQLGHVVAEALAEAARQQEVALHVDDDQRRGVEVEGERTRLRVDGRHQDSMAATTSSEVATQPKTPPCMVTMCRAAAWLPG